MERLIALKGQGWIWCAGVGIKDIIVCGHSLWGDEGITANRYSLRANATRIRLVKTSGEATRRLVVDNYVGLEADKLLKIAIEQNVLTRSRIWKPIPQCSKLHSGQLNLHAWIWNWVRDSLCVQCKMRQFSLLEKRSFPVPDPLIVTASAWSKLSWELEVRWSRFIPSLFCWKHS